MLETNHKEAFFASAWLVETFKKLGAGARYESASALIASTNVGN